MRLTPVLAFLALLPGCAWVTEADMDRRTPELDNDGDGVAAFEDCNDADAAVSPLLDETWYNGVDNDCDGRDDYDQDEDGFVATGYDGLATPGVEGSGGLPGGDCDDGARASARSNPTPGTTAWTRTATAWTTMTRTATASCSARTSER